MDVGTRSDDWGAGRAGVGTVVGEPVVFACPVCGSPLCVAGGDGELAGVCPVCRSGVVAPQPEFGCRAMLYREWLRLQECEVGEDVVGKEEVGRSGSAGWWWRSLSGKGNRWIGRSGKAWWWLVGGLVIGLGAVGWVCWPQGGGVDGEGGSKSVVSSVGEGDVVDPGGARRADGGAAAPLAATGGTEAAMGSLEQRMIRAAEDGGWVEVAAMRAHSFARTAPSGDGFWCLKLTDGADGAVGLRVYLPVAEGGVSRAEKVFAWGREEWVRVRVQWQGASRTTETGGHWVVVAYEVVPRAAQAAR
jgi:hypothetical protein